MIVQFVERYTVKRAQNFIIKAPFAQEFVRSLNPTAPIFLLENIVHEAFFEVERRVPGPQRKIIFIGTLINTKGVEELVRAFHAVAPKHPGLELHLLGTGTEAYVEGVLKPLLAKGPGRVVLRGHVGSGEIAKEFSDAAMVVLPSYFETSPNVVSEAMVAGVPDCDGQQWSDELDHEDCHDRQPAATTCSVVHCHRDIPDRLGECWSIIRP